MYSTREEKANIISHGFGFILFLTLGLILVAQLDYHDWVQIISGWTYTLSLLILYAASTLYHMAPGNSLKRSRLRIFDHSAIYVLIAGSYTPFCLMGLGDPVGYKVIIIVWGIAIIGVVLKLFFTGKFDRLSTLLYLFMGWFVVLYWPDLNESLSTESINLLILGGIFYSIGAVLYAIPKLPFNHAIFHIFVLAGSLTHFYAIYKTIFLF